MISVIRYPHAVIAIPFAILLVVPQGQALGGEGKGGDKPRKTIELSDPYIIPIVLKGKTARLKVAADALKWPILNGGFATALDLKSGPFKGKGKTEEGDQFTVSSKIVRSQYGDSKKRQRALWVNRDSFTDFDGVVGPTGIGYDVVRLKLRAAVPGEHVITHPLRSFPFVGLVTAFFEIDVAGERVNVDFNLDRHDTLVNASTGKLLADHYGGALSGDPVNYRLFNSQNRPGRRLVLTRQFLIDGYGVGDIAVRIRPEAKTAIPDSTVVPDPDEIVVTANAKKKPRYAITLGTDYLKGCSSITYDLRAKTVALSCQQAIASERADHSNFEHRMFQSAAPSGSDNSAPRA